MNAYPRNANVAAYQSAAIHGGVASADPHHLVTMLMDAALERMNSARGCIEHNNVVSKTKLLYNCVQLLAELRGTLDMEKGGAIAQNLSDIYDYMVRRLLLANVHSDATAIVEVSSLLREIREGWIAIGADVQIPAPVPASAA